MGQRHSRLLIELCFESVTQHRLCSESGEVGLVLTYLVEVSICWFHSFQNFGGFGFCLAELLVAFINIGLDKVAKFEDPLNLRIVSIKSVLHAKLFSSSVAQVFQPLQIGQEGDRVPPSDYRRASDFAALIQQSKSTLLFGSALGLFLFLLFRLDLRGVSHVPIDGRAYDDP